MAERHFIPLASPFEVELSGTRLVEAGAGTGKTWTIAALVLRLLLERELAIGEILVVTYTRAATGELRGRIRARLVEALAALEAGHAEEPYLRELLSRLSPDLARARLRLAIESFDTAAIHTIHGFCQRALAETAFAAGQAFERELIADAGELVEAVARDVWRRALADASRLWAGWLIDRLAGPAGLVKRVRGHLGRVGASLEAPEAVDRAAVERDFCAAHDRARELWRADAATILAWLATAKLHQQSYKPEKLQSRAEALADYFANAETTLPLPKDADHFGLAKILDRRTAASPEPEHPFFAAMDELLGAAGRVEAVFDAATRVLVRDFLLTARAALDEQKRRTGRQTYDDLLVDLARALEGAGGPALAASLRGRYRAALVDEFQDTDPLQLSIFSVIFGAASHPLVFVGDPKQAIYGFRGADVFAYLAARERAAAGYALLENRRSDAPLLAAMNALFDRPRPFLLDALPFDPARPATMERKAFRVADNQAPLTLWLMDKPPEARSFAKEMAQAQAGEAVAADIARLLALAAEGGATLDGRPLAGGDIAVLVRKRSQGEAVRRALARRGIASVALGGGSIWRSEEAEEIERLLLAVAQPAREGLVRAALATVLLGADATRLAAWTEDDAAWSECLERFHDDHRQLRERGFAAMWRRLLRREAVVPRVLGRSDGERRMTNYRHLAELLQAAEHTADLDATGLARHLARQRAAPESEEHQLRLESDAQLVRIVTIHASKGLQYPVVYCPFLWDGRQEDKAGWPVLAHDEARSRLDFGSERIDALRRQADLEAAAEELRLAYVAVTRAEHRCVLVWGKANQCERSPLAWLLFGPREAADGDPRTRLADKLEKSDTVALVGELRALEEKLGGALAVAPMPTEGGGVSPVAAAARPLAARPFRGTIPAPWRVASFSALAARLTEGETPDRDAQAASSAVPPAPTFASIFDFPRGTKAGSCLHALFERCDFRDLGNVDTLAAGVLRDFGFAPEWRPVLARLVADVVATPLADGLRLADVAREARLVELEFAFPLGSAAERAGYMKGFIDLVFRHGGRWYIVDWKSNWLGERCEDYARPRLDEVMRAHRYDLQLLIYAAALKRALAARAPELDWEAAFGGVFYLFVRGMRPGADHGIHFARPDAAAIDAWSREVRS